MTLGLFILTSTKTAVRLVSDDYWSSSHKHIEMGAVSDEHGSGPTRKHKPHSHSILWWMHYADNQHPSVIDSYAARFDCNQHCRMA
jgi:hypothetical protein